MALMLGRLGAKLGALVVALPLYIGRLLNRARR